MDFINSLGWIFGETNDNPVIDRAVGFIRSFYQKLQQPLTNEIMLILAAFLVFGLLNCFLGYRMLRFWVMLAGFGIGAAAALYAADRMLPEADHMIQLGAAVGGGILVAVIAMLVYKAGIFVLGAGLGIGISIYLLHPTSSAVFFLCILIGVVLGSLAIRYSKEVLIIGTSLVGGAFAGFSGAHLLELSEIPYSLLIGLGAALVGILIQFLTNRDEYEEDDGEDEEEQDEEEEGLPDLDEIDYARIDPELFEELDLEDLKDGQEELKWPKKQKPMQ
ncbi:MAG: TMEM198/TM7SF3 family protein [Blautia sp.]|nr:TMEM198/TM7SF3 family protein [Blautia sp.]